MTAFREEMPNRHKAQRAANGVDRRLSDKPARERVPGQQLILGAGWLTVQSSLYIFLNIFVAAEFLVVPFERKSGDPQS